MNAEKFQGFSLFLDFPSQKKNHREGG